MTVDSFPAHLAGALGVPVWTLLHADADWRWMAGSGGQPVVPDDAAVPAGRGPAGRVGAGAGWQVATALATLATGR